MTDETDQECRCETCRHFDPSLWYPGWGWCRRRRKPIEEKCGCDKWHRTREEKP
jgi:hypothetical protein